MLISAHLLSSYVDNLYHNLDDPSLLEFQTAPELVEYWLEATEVVERSEGLDRSNRCWTENKCKYRAKSMRYVTMLLSCKN